MLKVNVAVSFEILSLNSSEERKANVRIVQTTSLQSTVYNPTSKLICSCHFQSVGRPEWTRLIKFIVGILV